MNENGSIEECTDEILMCLCKNMNCFSKERGNLKYWIIVISKDKALTYKKKLRKLKSNIDLDKVKIDSSINIEGNYLKE